MNKNIHIIRIHDLFILRLSSLLKYFNANMLSTVCVFERFVLILGMARISGWIEGLKEKYWHFQEGRGVDYAKILFVQPALRALGLLLADGNPTVGGGKTF